MPLRLCPALLVLTGCATVGSLSSASPSAVYSSTKPPSEAVRCLSTKLADLVGGPIVTPSETGERIAFMAGQNAYLVVVVSPEVGGSHISVMQQIRYAGGVRRRVESCI